MLESKERGAPVRFEYSAPVDGREAHISATTVHVPGTAANRLYFALLADDITERKRMENALRASESEYRSLFDDALDLIHICDAGGIILDANQSELRALGYTKQEYLGKQILDMVHPEMRETISAQFARLLQNGEAIHELPATLLSRSGRSVHVIVNAFPHFDRTGRVVQMRSMMRDVTDRRQKEQLLASVLDTANDGVLTTDKNGIIQMANRSAERLLGADGPLQGKSFLNFIAHAESMESLFSEKPAKTQKARRANGSSFPVELGISKFHLDFSDYYTVFFRDITQRKSLEEQLGHSRRMEAVGKLAGGIAHDFNNLLMIVLGYAEVLLAQTDDALNRKSLTAIQQAAERGAALTQQLLTFSKKQSHEPVPVDLNSLIAATDQMLRRILGENVLLATSLADDLVPVVADRTQIEQIVLNLALNARDAMPDGGRLRIETSNVFLDEEFCQNYSECAPGRYAGITISDTGIGMTPEIQARIFEPFFTTKPPGQGTGLGLATVYGCVNQNGGVILVNSAPGRGTTFDIFFPASAEPAVADPARPVPPAGPRGVGETILLVEDEDGVREVAHLALQREGYRVIEAPNAEAALALVENNPHEIDLLLTDIVMPGMNGRQLADRLKSRLTSGRVLLMTGYTDDPAASVYPVIRKPFTPRALAQRVREILDKAESDLVTS
jgi:two-component system cell cycle sensor histidine kinase/response regulator CckA